MSRRGWPTAGLTVTGLGALAGATSAYLAYSYFYPGRPIKQDQDTFRAWVRVDRKTKEMRVFPLLSHAAVQSLLTTHVRSSSAVLSGGKKWSWNVAQVASNDPCEDTHAEMVIARDDPAPAKGKSTGEMLYFAVMDGHAGPWTSELLSHTLIPRVALELENLMKGRPALSATKSFPSLTTLLPSAFRPDGTAKPELVAQALKHAYTSLDSALTDSVVHMLDRPPDKRPQPSDVAAYVRASLSGSCALLSVLDTHHEQIHVALVGDCRAVAGYYDADKKQWIAEVLTEDQTAKALAEVERLKKEHPGEEDTVARNGRVLGGLEPSRAFGDARYKWTAEQQERIRRELVQPPDVLTTPPAYRSPPYVTANPVISHRPFQMPIPSSASSGSTTKTPAPTAQFRFLILATDGLWDVLSSKEAVTIAATHLSHTQPGFPSSDLPPVLGNAGVEGKGRSRDEEHEGQSRPWVYDERDTTAVCLIRNALGGTAEQVRRMLSMRAPFSRRERDDMTVSVIWWEDVPKETQVLAKL